MKRWRVTSIEPVTCGPSAACAESTFAAARAARAAATRSVGDAGGRALDQVGEHRVVEAAPPIGGDRRDRGGRIGAERRRRGQRRRGVDAARADAAGERHARHRRHRDEHRRHRPRHRAHGDAGALFTAFIRRPRLGRLAVGDHSSQHVLQLRPLRLGEAGEVLVEHLREHDRHFLCRDLAFRRELDANDAAVVGRALAAAEALGLEAIEQARHRARIALASRAPARRPSWRGRLCSMKSAAHCAWVMPLGSSRRSAACATDIRARFISQPTLSSAQ